MVSVEDRSLEGAGLILKQSVWDAARSTMEAWTGQRVAECSLYGIRVYEEGAVLATHVDRLPLVSACSYWRYLMVLLLIPLSFLLLLLQVSSAIINVDQVSTSGVSISL